MQAGLRSDDFFALGIDKNSGKLMLENDSIGDIVSFLGDTFFIK